ncbi:MAG: AraC family transcriptional regulator [Balneolaceae bacterium]|nr:AraC family transcriptional regulator [Balneolaceae bacterium]
MKLIVPNGRLLLLLPFQNGLIGKKEREVYVAKQHKIALAGISNSPSVVDSEREGPTGTIGVEINPIGAYRFFHLRLGDIKNELNDLTDLLGKSTGDIERKMANANDVEDKVRILQHFMHSLLIQEEQDLLFEYCIRQIEDTKGGIKVGELEEDTGYSSRWLNMKFQERLGMSPKNLSTIVRFQQYYQALLANKTGFITRKTFYDHYYDESHFIKEFKKFTGYSPSTLMQSNNHFGRMFYER